MANARLRPDDPIGDAEALIAEGRAADAAAQLRTRLEENRGGLLLRLTLQKALAASGDVDAALQSARETAQLYPDAAPAALGLAHALQTCGHLPAAIAEFQRALRFDPENVQARIGLGSAWLDAGEAERAIEAWHGIEEMGGAVPETSIADARRALREPRCDPRYVRQLFDQFAGDYDSRMLGQLHYRAPAILREFAEFLGLAAGAPHSILDLGCGTGLMGAALGDWALRLDGVDLSPAMAAKARARGIYDEIVTADICSWLAEQERNYDLVVAADTLVYLGDLTPVFASVAARLAPGGHFLFTVEAMDGDGFALGPKRRWQHSQSFLRVQAAAAGLNVAGFMDCSPRDEGGVAVRGYAVALAPA
ncbi:MAG TPA: methyltransferase domain-containing protein [Rhizomicrobium sp.]|jgi:predicted TPR repeat methyltransferase